MNIAIIPARSGSKGIANKNLMRLGDHSLLERAVISAKKSGIFDCIVVSTDSLEYFNSVADMGIVDIGLRPGHLSGDKAIAVDVACYTLNCLDIKPQSDANLFWLQPTSPFRYASHIVEAINHFANKNADSLVSVTKIPHNCVPNSIYKKADDDTLDRVVIDTSEVYLRQKKEVFWARNGAAIYITKVKDLISQKSFLNGKLVGYEMDSFTSIDIDEMEDFELAKIVQPYLDRKYFDLA